MMYKDLLGLLALVVLFPSRSDTAPHISVVCEENNVGNCIVEWEMALLIKGNVEVYISADPDAIPEDVPVAMADISDLKITAITNDPAKRCYYTLLFGDKYRMKIATRDVNIPGMQNSRDPGGYPFYSTKKQVRWGIIYHSAEVDSLECYSRRELRNLGIRTLIGLRISSGTDRQSPLQEEFNAVHIPFTIGDTENILKGIREEKIKSDTVCRMIKQMNRDLIDKYTTEYRQVSNILLDRNSYPIVIHYSSGKGRTDVVFTLVLAALSTNEDIIMEDYRLSNGYFNIPNTLKGAYQLPARSQEAITTLFLVREDFLNATREEVERRYDNIDSYLQEDIGLNRDEIERLRSILLSDQ